MAYIKIIFYLIFYPTEAQTYITGSLLFPIYMKMEYRKSVARGKIFPLDFHSIEYISQFAKQLHLFYHM